MVRRGSSRRFAAKPSRKNLRERSCRTPVRTTVKEPPSTERLFRTFVFIFCLLLPTQLNAQGTVPTPTPQIAHPPESPSPVGWTVQRSLFAFGAVESNEGFPFGFITGDVEPNASLSMSGTLEAAREMRVGRFRTAAYGLVRSPESGRYRAFFVAGRAEFSRPLGNDWRLTIDDLGKLQRRPNLDVANLERNDFGTALEWRPKPSVGLLGQFSDRRRGYDGDFEFLNYNRQALRGALFGAPRARVRAEGGLAWQRWDALFAAGRRLVTSGELVVLPERTLISVKYAWFRPFNDIRKFELFGPPDLPDRNVPDEVLYYDIILAAFMELLALQSSEAELASEAFFLEPIESDNDEWDFGRHKHVLGVILSRRLDDRTSVGALLRFQYRRGPLLINPEYLAPELRDDRVLARFTFRHRVSRRFALLLQVSHLRNDGERDYARFSRTLGAFGMQLLF